MNRQALINSYAVAFKMGYKINRHHKNAGMTWDEVAQNYRLLKPGECNLLETVLIGAEDCTGDWLFDVAIRLQSTPQFLEGFIAGLAFEITPEDKPT